MWQAGGGYDRNLFNWDTIEKAIDYVEWNPVTRGFVSDPKDWVWSSARARSGEEDVHLRIDEFIVSASSMISALGKPLALSAAEWVTEKAPSGPPVGGSRSCRGFSFDLHLVQRALGHRQITTTEIYARVSDDSLRRAVAAPSRMDSSAESTSESVTS